MKAIKMKCFATLMVVLFLLPLAGIAAGEGEKEIEGTGTISGDIFEKGGRYYHAFLSLYGAYNDNIFNISEDEESDFITVISPGVQLVFPSTKMKPLPVETGTTTTGGLPYFLRLLKLLKSILERKRQPRCSPPTRRRY